jgi:hypothetical protein
MGTLRDRRAPHQRPQYQASKNSLAALDPKLARSAPRLDCRGADQESDEGAAIPGAAPNLETGDFREQDLMSAGRGIEGPRPRGIAGKLEGIADQVRFEENEVWRIRG